MHLQEDQLITAPFLSAVAEVKKFEPRSGYYRLEVVLRDGHHTHKSLQITDGQLAQIQVLERSPTALTGNAEDFFFLIEADRIQPHDIAFFHGVLDMKKLNLAEKLIVKALKAPVGDFRDWDVIASWAEDIADALKKEG